MARFPANRQKQSKAFAEYEKFNKTQRIESDFDKAVKQIKAVSKNNQRKSVKSTDKKGGRQ